MHYNRCIIRHILYNNTVSSYFHIVTNFYITNYFSPCTNFNIISYFCTARTNSHLLINTHILTKFCFRIYKNTSYSMRELRICFKIW